MNADHIWVKWVNSVYLKDEDWWNFTYSNYVSWAMEENVSDTRSNEDGFF